MPTGPQEPLGSVRHPLGFNNTIPIGGSVGQFLRKKGLQNYNTEWGSISVEGLAEAFETVSKNLKSYPYILNYGVDGIDTIVYDLSGGLSITKTFTYAAGILTTITLSGDTPSGIDLIKTLSYTGIDLTSVAYS